MKGVTKFEDLPKEKQDRPRNAFPGNFITEDELIPRLDDLIYELADEDICLERLWLEVISHATSELEILMRQNQVKW